MTYNKEGLGISELTYLAVNYPEIYDTIEDCLQVDEELGLELARKSIEAINFGLVSA